MRNPFFLSAIPFLALLLLLSCSDGDPVDLLPDSDGDQDDDIMDTESSEDTEEELAELEENDTLDIDTDPEQETEPVFNPQAAARGFQLYYKERVERIITAYNRYGIFGDIGFGITIGKVGIAKEGEHHEIVPGPNDNNMIGLSVWTAWNAYKIFQTRKLALGMVRMFEGLSFMESVSGHSGLTARCAYPGYTLDINGTTGEIQRSRDGQTVASPMTLDSDLEKEITEAFFRDLSFTYRENPADFMFDYMPAVEIGPYCVTYGFSMLPDYIRVSDCCTSLMQTPEGYAWKGAFWSNHNSRDNFPDLGLGYLAALEATKLEDIDSDVAAAAQHAWTSANHVGDSVQQHEGCLMTVDEHNPYETLVVAGTVRPDGETESEDLGSLSSCPMAFLARAISSQGLSLPSPELPLPGSIEFIMDGLFDECHASEEVRMCSKLNEGYCGKTWGTMDELHFFGNPWLEFAQEIEDNSPGSAEKLLGSFQDDYYEITLAMVALAYYARIMEDADLLAEAKNALFELTSLMRTFADLIYMQTQEDRWKRRRYEAALFDTWSGLEGIESDLLNFARAESYNGILESLLALEDTGYAPIVSNEEILRQVEERWSARSDTVKARYRDTYGDIPPLRSSEAGYEALTNHPDTPVDWHEVATPRHKRTGGFKLLEALPLCISNPTLLDCSWARFGCKRPDLDADGQVSESDLAQFEALFEAHSEDSCDAENAWCEGADLDQSGALEENDRTFMNAAQGCWYEID